MNVYCAENIAYVVTVQENVEVRSDHNNVGIERSDDKNRFAVIPYPGT